MPVGRAVAGGIAAHFRVDGMSTLLSLGEVGVGGGEECGSDQERGSATLPSLSPE